MAQKPVNSKSKALYTLKPINLESNREPCLKTPTCLQVSIVVPFMENLSGSREPKRPKR